MSVFFRYFFLVLLGVRCAVFSQPAVEGPAPANTVKTIETQPARNDEIEPPPSEPAETPNPPVKKRRKTVAQQRFRVSHHSNAVFNENIVVKPGETIRELVLFGGSADIQGTVERDVVIIGGNATISGTVQGGLVLVGGSLECSGTVEGNTHAVLAKAHLTEAARLERGAVFVGGPFDISPSATIAGQRVIVPFGDVIPKVEGLKNWLVHGLIWGRLLPIGVHWAWLVAGFFVTLYFLTLLLFPGAIKAIFLALEARPVTSVLAGFLTLILFAPLVAILVIAIVGIPVVPFLQVALVLGILFGKAAVMCFLGRSFGRSAGAAILQTPLAAFLVGATLLVLAYMIPIFGVLAWILATVFGLGGAVVAMARTFKREEASVPLAPVMVAPRMATATAVPASGPFSASSGFVPPTLSAPVAPLPADTLLLRRAGFWKRLLASLLDWILLGVLIPLLWRGFLPVAVAYFVVLWTWKGTTIGSILLRLRVVRTDGSPMTFSVALVRSLSSFFSALVLFLGFLWVGWDREKQSWHDKIAGTVVVIMPKGFALL